MLRREFLQTSLAASAGGLTAAPAPHSKTIQLGDTIPVAEFGKTGHQLPLLACGGSAMVEKWSEIGYYLDPLPLDQRVAMVRRAYEAGVRYFDTSRNYLESESILGQALKDVRGNIYLATKVGVRGDGKGILEPRDVRASVEESLKTLQTDYVDCIQIHGPAYEYMGYDRAMGIYEQLDKLRGEKLFRFIGVTGHTAFEIMYKLVDQRLFDSVFLAYGYFPKGMDTMLSLANLEWRKLVLARARELNMGILAMKVLGSFAMGHGAGKLAPDLDEARLKATRQAALRWALREPKPPVLVVGISRPSDVDENIATLRANRSFTAQDQKLLAEFTARALKSPIVQNLKTT